MTMKPGFDGQPPELREPRNRRAWAKEHEIPRQNINTDRLEWLLAHRRIAEYQLLAGRRLQQDWELSQLAPYAALDPGRREPAGAGSMRLPDVKLDAMRRYGDAMKSVGRSGGTLIRLVVLENISLEKAAALMRMPARGALPALQVALDSLASHYGFA